MSSDCYRTEELARIVDLGSNNPQRSHLDECPRCQARLETYQEFMHPDNEFDQAEFDHAMDKLGSEIDQEIFGASNTDSTSNTYGSSGNNLDTQNNAATIASQPNKPSVFHFRSPYVRASLALAACLLLFFSLSDIWNRPDGDTILLRSDDPTQPKEDLALDEPKYLSNGSVELSWQPILEADSYIVVILNAELDEVARQPAVSSSPLLLDISHLEDLLGEPGNYAWYVIALKNGNKLLVSRSAAFHFGSEL